MDYKKFDSIRKVQLFQLRENDVFIYNGAPYAFIKKTRRRNSVNHYSVKALNLNTNQYWRLYFIYEDGFDHVGEYVPASSSSACQPNNLTKGELFTLVGRRSTELWRFESFDGNKVHAVNPLNNRRVKIGHGFEFVKISDLPY